MEKTGTLMSSVFSCIPGMELPVSEVVSAMAKMWESEPVKGRSAPSEFRASQMNLILHLGYNTTPDEAKELFRTVNEFAHAYPSRIIILCPTPSDDPDRLLIGKLYSECYIGKSMRDMRCCEILTLGYDENAPKYMENQISVWLESDLPTYYWSHRLPAQRINTTYKDFLRFCKRKVYDSSVEGRQFRSQLDEPKVFWNLSYARLLPIRQSIGQVLSGFQPALLAEELQNVVLNCSPKYYPEGGALSHWIFNCLKACADESGSELPFSLVTVNSVETDGSWDFGLQFCYSGKKTLRFRSDITSATATLTGNMGRGDFDYSLKSGLLSPENALAEAIFFNS
jgi:hypothetical protein